MKEYPVPVAPPDRLPREGETILNRAQFPDYKIDVETGCWVWQKHTVRGYPQSAQQKPHRLYYERAHGPIPPKHDVHHLCHNPACVNPDHLRAMLHSQHVAMHQQAIKRVLTWDEAAEIRKLGADANVSPSWLAEKYGVSRRHIHDILNNDRFVIPGGKPVVFTRLCDICGERFAGKRRHARVCSPECKKASLAEWRRANREAA